MHLPLVVTLLTVATFTAQPEDRTPLSPKDKLSQVKIEEFAVTESSIANALRVLNEEIRRDLTNGVPPVVRLDDAPTRLVHIPEDPELAREARSLFGEAMRRRQHQSLKPADLPPITLNARDVSALNVLTQLSDATVLGWWESGNDIVLRSTPPVLACGAWRVDDAYLQELGVPPADIQPSIFLSRPPRYDQESVVWLPAQRVLLMVDDPRLVEFFGDGYKQSDGKMKPVAKAKGVAQ